MFSARLFDRGPSVLSPALWADTVGGIPKALAGAGRVIRGLADADRGEHQPAGRCSSSSPRRQPCWSSLPSGTRSCAGPAPGPRSQSPTPARRVLMATAVVVADIGVPVMILFGLRSRLCRARHAAARDRRHLRRADPSRSRSSPSSPAWRGRSPPPAGRSGGSAASPTKPRDGPTGSSHRRVPDRAAAARRQSRPRRRLPPSWAVGFGGILAVPTALLALLATRVLVLGRDGLSAEEHARALRWRVLTPIAAAAAVVTIIAAGIGYLAFARFTIEQIAWVWVVAGLYVVLAGLADLAINALLLPIHAGGPAGRPVDGAQRPGRRTHRGADQRHRADPPLPAGRRADPRPLGVRFDHLRRARVGPLLRHRGRLLPHHLRERLLRAPDLRRRGAC